MTPLVSKSKSDHNIFWKIVLIGLNQIYDILKMPSIKWRVHVLTVLLLLSFTLLIVLFGLWGVIRGKGDILWLFQKDYRIQQIISILLIPPLIYIFLKAMDFFIKTKCNIFPTSARNSSTFKSLLIFQYIFFPVLMVVCLIPVFLGTVYYNEAIGTTFLSLLYHVQSIVNWEVPFWFPESALGFSLPMRRELFLQFA